MEIAAWDNVAHGVNFNPEINVPGFSELVDRKARVLEVGCGYGRITDELYRTGYRNIIGVDPSGEMIRRGNAIHPNLELHKINGEELHFSDEAFEAVVICAVLTCLPRPHQKKNVIAEASRVLAPGGILHLVEFCNEQSNTFKSKLGVEMHHQHPAEIQPLLTEFAELSFEVVSTETMGGSAATAVSYFGQKETPNK